MDIHNEPFDPASWGDGNIETDWRLAAKKCGDTIHAISTKYLIMVEGIQSYKGSNNWWGGNLGGVFDYPLELNTPNRVVYSPHEYCQSVFPQSWFNEADYPLNMYDIWKKNWGYLVSYVTE
jgi:endoglucanase